MTLKELEIGKSAVIKVVGGEGALRQHFLDMGVIPGLGAEITTPEFNKEFRNKQIFSGNQLVGILVVKGGNASGANEVDAISGGTITSKGVETMIKNYLTYYEPFLKQK